MTDEDELAAMIKKIYLRNRLLTPADFKHSGTTFYAKNIAKLATSLNIGRGLPLPQSKWAKKKGSKRT